MEILIWIAAGSMILFASLRFGKENSVGWEISDKSYRIIFPILTVVFIFLLTFKLTEVPMPYHIDEAGMAYDAKNIANYHYDRYLYRFPVYFNNFGSGQSALYIYMAAILIKLFGYSIFVVRIPAVFLSVVSACIFCFTIRREHGNTASVLTMFFFCVLPFSIMHSRWGLDAYLFFPMLIVSCCAFYYSIQNGKTVWYFFSGCLFGLTLYSYAISFVIVPLFLTVLVIYLGFIRKISWKKLFAMGIPLFLLAFPLILFMAVNNGMIGEIRNRFFSIPKLQTYMAGDMNIKNIFNNLRFGKENFFYVLFVDDHFIYNSVSGFGSMYFISLPFIIYGFILCGKECVNIVRQKKFNFGYLILFLFLISLPVSLMISPLVMWRICALYIPLIYFLVLGILAILKKSRNAFMITICIYLILSFSFFRYYFVDYNKDLDSNIIVGSITDLSDALDFAEEMNRYDGTIYVLDPHVGHIYVLLDRDIDPVMFNEQKFISNDDYVKIVGKYRFRLDAVMPDCVYIFRDRNKMPENPEEYGFRSKQFGSFYVYYPKPE